jgi:glycosyltransferase involved in cell wall biosynthesis
VVVDDGSTDNTEAVVRRLVAEVDGLRLNYLKTEPGGCARARNLGLQIATGAYVQHLDSDDILLPHKIAAQISYLEQYPDAGAVYSFSQTIDGAIPAKVIGAKAYCPDDLLGFCLHPWVSILDPLVVLWRRDVFGRVGKYDCNLCRWVDWDFAVRFLSANGRIGCLPEYLAAYRVHEDRVTSRAHGERGIRDGESMVRALTTATEQVLSLRNPEYCRALSERAWLALGTMRQIGADHLLKAVLGLLGRLERSGGISSFVRYSLRRDHTVEWARYRLLTQLYGIRIHLGRLAARASAKRPDRGAF